MQVLHIVKCIQILAVNMILDAIIYTQEEFLWWISELLFGWILQVAWFNRWNQYLFSFLVFTLVNRKSVNKWKVKHWQYLAALKYAKRWTQILYFLFSFGPCKWTNNKEMRWKEDYLEYLVVFENVEKFVIQSL